MVLTAPISVATMNVKCFRSCGEDCKLHLGMSPVVQAFTKNNFQFIGAQKWLFLE